MTNRMRETPQSIQAWLASLIPTPTVAQQIQRAGEEWDELMQTHSGTPEELEEVADVAICLISHPAIWAAVEAKMVINRARSWQAGENGNIYHAVTPDA